MTSSGGPEAAWYRQWLRNQEDSRSDVCGNRLDDPQQAAAAFRQAILAAIPAAPFGQDVVALLRRASEVFPHSARLAAEYATALHRAGQLEEAYRQYSRAWALRRQAALYQEEFPREEGPPYLWQFADHIRLHWQSEPET